MFDIVLNSSVVWSDLSHPEGLSGLVVDVWSAGASERRRSAPASLHAAGRFSSLSGAAGGAVPQTHVPMLTVSNLETEPSGSTEQPWAGALTEEDGSDSPQTISLSYSTEPLTLCDIDWSDGLLNPSDDPSQCMEAWFCSRTRNSKLIVTLFPAILRKKMELRCWLTIARQKW